MLKMQRKMIDELCGLMRQAHSEIVNQISDGHTSETAEILQLCQEFMIRIGESVELSEGVEYPGIHDMEHYCELVYRISQSLEMQEQSMSYMEKLLELFYKVELEIQSVCIKKEIVFLPYNAAMWDCLESIWIAASQDPKFVVSVIPIPYYEKNSQGQVVAEKYDGGKFPPYVPIVDYSSYSLEEHQPEIAYIHNPFDSYNNITTVHPDYYSKELKKYVKRLVYVPYFVTEDAVFVTHRELPAYYYVDNIVVQCEKMMGSFASTIKSDKFIPVGSPIADRIINLDLHKPDIPDSWKAMLPNGDDFGGKKVVMFNTSLSMMMREREKFLDKIEYVIRMFRRVEDVILVWRPHPLMHSTLQNMGIDLYNRFLAIESMFVQERLGILDKTTDVGIAVALCDAYVGEDSSAIIHMFGIAGKPRFYINLQLPNEDDYEEGVTVFGSYSDNDKEYFVGEEYRCLFQRNLSSGEIKLLAEIPGTKWYPHIAYRDIYKYGDNLYLQPYSGQGLCIYNMKEGSFRKLYVRNSCDYGFKAMLAYEKYLYLIPNQYPEVVRFNTDTEGFEYVDQCDEAISKVVKEGSNICDKPQEIYYQLPDSVLVKLMVNDLLQRTGGGTVWENEINRLRNFLYYVVDESSYDKRILQSSYATRIATMDGTCGIKVHEYIKNRVG
jgi:hypothetical protein